MRTARLRIAFGYGAGPEEVLAGGGVRPDPQASPRFLRGRPCIPRIPTTSDMPHAIHHSNYPQRVITPQAQPHPAHCDHEHEALAHRLSDALQCCAKRGSQEVK